MFEDVSLTVALGERVAVMGGSGSGKTTLLKVLAALRGYEPASGTCYRKGRVAMMFQQPLLLSYKTVLENMRLPMKLSRAIVDETEVIELLGLRPLLDRYPYEISGGQQRRVALARALLTPDTSCLVLDEAFTGLDEPLKERILDQLVAYLTETRLPCIYATHSAAEAAYLATRVLFIGGSPARIHAEHRVGLPEARFHDLRDSEQYFGELRAIRHLIDEVARQ